jgi:hypothetical protein
MRLRIRLSQRQSLGELVKLEAYCMMALASKGCAEKGTWDS